MNATTSPYRPALGLNEIKRRLHAEIACLKAVDLVARDDGFRARLRLDPLMIRARADQQGIEDRSVRAAAACTRFQALIATDIDDVNTEVGDHGLAIREHVILFD
jgi:hypothetical protein